MKEYRKTRHGADHVCRTAYFLALFSFVFSAILAPKLAVAMNHEAGGADFRLITLQSILGALAVNLPLLIRRWTGWRIPRGLTLYYLLFLWCSIFLGEALGFYYRFTHWDDMLHLSCGAFLGVLGFYFFRFLSGKSGEKHDTPPFLAAIFSLFFALSVGAMWEIYEYTCDGLLHINMQKFAEGSAISGRLTPLLGREALRDTMEDLIVDFLGASIAALAGYFITKRGAIRK